MENSNNNCPSDIDFLTCDQIAECYDGISKDLYKKLWEITSAASNAGKAQPLGGDGSNGTVEYPMICSSYDNNLKQAWQYFTPDERKLIIKVTALD